MESPRGVIPLNQGPGSSPTFGALAEEWLRVEGARWSRPTNVHRHVLHMGPLWAMTEAELRPAVVKELLYSLVRPRGRLSGATVNKVRGTGSLIIREAQLNDRWEGKNPFEVVRRLHHQKPEGRSLSLEEVRMMLPHLPHQRRLEALVTLYVGLRTGELKALQREDVDLERKVMVIRRSNGRNQTKTGAERTIPIPDALAPVLEEALWGVPPDCPLVFPGPSCNRQGESSRHSRSLKAALRAAGLVSGYRLICRRGGCGYRTTAQMDPRGHCPRCGMKLFAVGIPINVRFYDLRHSCASLHREAGADPLAIQRALGHAPKSMTDNVYTRMSLDVLRRELNKLKI